MLSARSIEIIESSPGWRRHRIEFFDLPEGRMVVKGQRPARGPWAHRVLNGIAALAGVPCLKAVPVHGGQKAQDVEVRRLRALAAAGVRVPKVLHVAQDYFVMENMGSTNLVCQLAEGGGKLPDKPGCVALSICLRRTWRASISASALRAT